jgi:hypothetical protein
MGWFRQKDGSLAPRADDDNAGLEDVEFKPKEFQENLDKTLAEKFTALETKQAEAMKPMQEMAELMKTERAERAAAEAKRAAAAKKEEQGDFGERMMLDPESAIDEKLQGTNRALLMLASREAKRETLGEKEYYHGAVKARTDALIESLPLAQRSNSGSLENCYKIACFDHQKEIAEGKIKARNTSGIFEGGSTGAPSGGKAGEDSATLTEDEKKIAKNFGMSEKEWGASKREMTYV